LTLTLTNGAGVDAANLAVTDHLPAPLVVDGAASTTCPGGTLTAAMGANAVSLAGATLPAAGCTITVPVQWPTSQPALCLQAAPGNAVTNTVTPGTDFSTAFGQTNTPASASLACTGVPPPMPVPVNAPWAMALMGLLLGVWGGVRVQKRTRRS
jgi:hypothetical protein